MSRLSPHEISESLRKARRRGDLLLALDAVSVAHAAHLAELARMAGHRVVWMMHGKLPYYRPDRSLAHLGLAREVDVPRGRAYAITALGRRVAKALVEQRRLDARVAEMVRARVRRDSLWGDRAGTD